MVFNNMLKSHSNYQQVTPDLERIFYNKIDSIVSMKGGDVEANTAQKRLCLLFRDGDFIIDKESARDVNIRIFRDIASKKGFKIRNTYASDIQLIRLLYLEAERELITKDNANNEPMEVVSAALLETACQLRCSDIHIRIYEHEAEIMFRLNGDIIKQKVIEAEQAHSLATTLYNASKDADSTYRLYDYQAARVSSDSRINFPANLQSIRLQYSPLSSGGRYLVARLLYSEKKSKVILVENQGFLPIQINQLEQLRRIPEGVNIVCGPTGSGKSTTLKVLLETLYAEREGSVNILTIEDPPEYEINGAVQLPVTNADGEESRGKAYLNAIVSALRSDPDIIMPGEARDATVISLVFTAAMTGHQVWTSIHANSALAVFDRLRDQGVEKYKMTDPDLMTGVIAQRLGKVICEHCSISINSIPYEGRYNVKQEIIKKIFSDWYSSLRVANLKGCQHCNFGFTGRTVIAEVLKPDIQFLKLMANDERELAFQYWLDNLDGVSMSEHAWIKAIQGICDPYEIYTKIARLEMIPEKRKILLYEMIT